MTTIDKQPVGCLKDAHAIQRHVRAALSEVLTTCAGEPEVCRPLGRHAERTRAHRREIEARLRAHRPAPSILRDAGTLFAAVPDAGLGRSRRDPVGGRVPPAQEGGAR